MCRNAVRTFHPLRTDQSRLGGQEAECGLVVALASQQVLRPAPVDVQHERMSKGQPEPRQKQSLEQEESL